MTPTQAIDAAWIATRSKALLTTKDRALLAEMRGAYREDPHLVAFIDALLAP